MPLKEMLLNGNSHPTQYSCLISMSCTFKTMSLYFKITMLSSCNLANQFRVVCMLLKKYSYSFVCSLRENSWRAKNLHYQILKRLNEHWGVANFTNYVVNIIFCLEMSQNHTKNFFIFIFRVPCSPPKFCILL